MNRSGRVDMKSEKLDRDTMSLEVKQIRHVLGLSGGKDSAALAIYLKGSGTRRTHRVLFLRHGARSCARSTSTLIG